MTYPRTSVPSAVQVQTREIFAACEEMDRL
jgi:hypothetical protein